jgi:hypothetical protein
MDFAISKHFLAVYPSFPKGSNAIMTIYLCLRPNFYTLSCPTWLLNLDMQSGVCNI